MDSRTFSVSRLIIILWNSDTGLSVVANSDFVVTYMCNSMPLGACRAYYGKVRISFNAA